MQVLIEEDSLKYKLPVDSYSVTVSKVEDENHKKKILGTFKEKLEILNKNYLNNKIKSYSNKRKHINRILKDDPGWKNF